MENLLMNNNILRSDPVYEQHNLTKNSLPFIFHKNSNRNSRCNLHENLELLYFMKGSGRVRCGNELYGVSTGDCIVVNSYMVHQIMTDGNTHYSWLIIDNRFCKANDIDIRALQFTTKIHDASLNTYYRNVVEAYSDGQGFGNTAVKCAVLTLLLYLCRSYSTPKVGIISVDDRAFNYVRLATDYIRKNVSKKISLEDIASAVGLSMYHFSREFKKTTGYSVMQYVNIIRCEHAQELLTAGNYKIKEVALLCGFESYSYFSNVYKSYTGTLPSVLKGAVAE